MNKTLLMITSYPAHNDRSVHNLNAVASYADHLVLGLMANLAKMGKKLVVVAEQLYGMPELYTEPSGLLVSRVWRRNDWCLFDKILGFIKRVKDEDTIIIQFEFNMFGGSVLTLLFPAFLLLLRLQGKNPTVVLHQVVEDLNELVGHLNLQGKSLVVKLFNLVLRFFYFLVVSFAHKIVVHDDILRQRLVNMHVDAAKVFVVPHGLGEYKKPISKLEARRDLRLPLNAKIVLCYGFITWYKGSDWIVEQFATCNDLILVMAGGESPNLKSHKYYQAYYNSVRDSANKASNIILTGYLPESLVLKYFSACDVVVLPYRTQMSASGPLAVAFSLGKPFLLSDKLSGALATFDVKEEMLRQGINVSDLVFDLTAQSLFSKINAVLNDAELRAKISRLSVNISESRNWLNVSRLLLDTIYVKNI